MSAAPISMMTIIDGARAAAEAVMASERKAIGLSVSDTRDLAQAFLAIDALARLAADYLAVREEMFAAGMAGDAAGESAADDKLDEIEPKLTERFVELGYLFFHPEQEAHDGQ
ncbi:Uncharacterised protein [Starkeya nomas]|uniref:Uncharacterized protein n=1 Tax=Starkeya nomas TaxID=2666134 RepID=A0A5S9R584_9HYPH|nr:hypothetical protein [Starkeya nomas]CAA0128966.1 Uncharacterised protein [Starkeya nomas]